MSTSNYTTTPPLSTPRTGPALSITTSSPSSTTTNSSSGKSPYTPHRTSSSPAFPVSPSPASATQRRATEPRTPRSAGYSGGMRSPTQPMRLGEGKRRHSNEGKVNVHTECGRHSDEWLFGGFSVAGAVRKMLGDGRDGGKKGGE